MKHYFLSSILFFFSTIICMEHTSDNTLSKELLCAKYCSLKEQKLIKIGDIKSDAISALNKELDAYYEQRLSTYSLPQVIEDSKVEKYILMKLCPEFNPLFNAVQHHMIAENVRNKCVVHEDVYSYESEIGNTGLVKMFTGGHFKFMPKVAGLTAPFFNGDEDESGFRYQDQLCILKAHALRVHAKTSAKTAYAITTSEVYGNLTDGTKLYLWKMNPNIFIKIIQHKSEIDPVLFSPDAQWIVSNSTGDDRKLVLTPIGDAAEDSYYLPDIGLISSHNTTSSFCINNASTVLAADYAAGNIGLFDLKTKERIAQLTILEPYTYALALEFNHDDSRLISYLWHDGDESKCWVMIWDTSDLTDIKELQKIEIVTEEIHNTKIIFKPDEKNIVAIATGNTAMFFDIYSGKFLSKTPNFLDQSMMLTAGLVFMPCSSVACIGVYKFHESESVYMYDYISGDCIGVIPYQEKYMNGIGITNNFKYLVATFNGYKAVKTQLLSDKQCAAFSKIVQKLTLVDFYALLQLHKARQEKCTSKLSQPLLDYIQESFFDDDKEQELIKKYFFQG